MTAAPPVRIAVRLTPRASKNAIQGWATDAAGNRVLRVSVTEVPEKGKANKALVALLAKEWKVPKSSIVLDKGAADRNKILILNEIPPGWPPP